MATGSNSREVELKLRVDTLGADGIRALEEDVRNLAAEGKIAADAGNRLADQIARLGENAAKLQSFQQLADDVRNLAQASERSGVNALALAEDLAKLNVVTGEAASAEAAAREELQKAAAALTAKREALKELKNGEDRAKLSADEYSAALRKMRLEILDAEQAERQWASIVDAAAAATKRAATEEGTMERSLRSATQAADADAAALSARNAALLDARAELAALGVETENAAASELKLSQALNASVGERERLKAVEAGRVEALRQEALEEEHLARIMVRARDEMTAAAKAEAAAIVEDWDKQVAAEKRAAEAAQQATNSIKNSFETVGAKSVASITAEIERVKAAMNTLRTTADLTGPELDRAMAAGSQRIKELERDLRAATGQLTLMDRASSALKTTVGQFAAAFGVVQVVQSLGTAFIESNKKMEQMRLGFGALYKNANVTAQQIDFLRQTANDAGVSFGSISESFLRFSASTQAANIPLAQTNALFAAVTRASATLGLSGDKVSHILDALSQMAGKGVVSMEELRQQMGDSLPGALSLVAKGLGITDQQLVKLVESGGLLARDLFPALTKALEGMQTPVNTLSATWERFKNVLSTISNDAADTGVWDVLKLAIATVGVAINGAAFSIGFFIDSLVTAGRVAGDFASGDLAEAGKEWDRYSARQEKAAIRLIENAKLLYGVGEATNYSAGELQTFNSTAKQTTQATAQATAGATAHAAAMTQGAAATQVATQATQALGTAAVQTGNSVVKLGVQYAETSKALELQTQVAEKLTKAREIEGKSTEAVVRLSGNEVAALDAARQAATNNLDSHTRLLAARNAEATALRTYIDQLKEEVRLHGDPGGVRTKDIQDRQKRLETLDAEAEREKQVVDSLKVEVASRQLARQSYDDNSKSLDLLRQVYLNTNDTLKDYEALQKQGFATQAQVDEARIRAGAAEGLYRDALNDTTKAMERQIELSKDRNVIEQAQIGLDKARATTLGALGDRLHDSNLQRVAQVEGLELERDARMKNASVMEQESNARLKDIDTQRQAQIELGTWNEQKQTEYQRLKASLEAKKLDAKATRESAEALQEEINKLREKNQLTDEASKKMFADNAKKLQEQYDRNKVREGSYAAQQGQTADGFKTNADGAASGTFQNNMPIDQAVRLRDTHGKGMTDDEIRTAIQQAKALKHFADSDPGGFNSPQFNNDVIEITRAATAAQQRLTQSAAAAKANAANPQSDASNRTVTVNIGGKATTIGVASQTDSDALVGMLRALESASNSSAP